MKQFLKLSAFAFIILCSLGVANAGNSTKQKSSKATKDNLTGWYVTDSYAKRAKGYDWVAVNITNEQGSKYRISARSKGNMKRPTCTFDCYAFDEGGNVLKSFEQGKTILFTINGKKLTISTEKTEDSGILSFCCSGGGSLAGSYNKLTSPIDTKQMDKTVFTKWLSMDKISFAIEQQDNKLTIRPMGLEIDNTPADHTVNGKAYDAELEDINSDGFPEVLVYLRDSKGYGSVIGYSVNNGKSMSDIYFQGISQRKDLQKGYRGKDEFGIVETTFVQRFPIYNEKGSTSKTSKTRQIQYKLKDGEASRYFAIDKVVEY